MKQIIFFFSLLFSVAITSCNNASAQQSHLLEPQQLLDKVNNEDVHFVDVRTPMEFNQGHIEGAINIDFMANDFADQLKQLDTDKPIVIYCRTGRRSGLTTRTLVEIGFKDIYDLKGGTISWQRQGFKLVM